MDPLEPEDNKHFIIRHRIKLIVAVVLLAALAALLMSGREKRPIRKAQPERVVSISAPAPLPPPPPRPPEQRPDPTPRTPDEMVVQEPVEAAPEEAPAEAPSAEPDNAPGPVGEAMGTNIEGDGTANSWGLSGKGGGGIIGGGGGGGPGRGGSRWGWYSGQMQGRIERALQEHEKTRSASLDINVRIWVDNTGRVTHAQLVGSSGDAELDEALRDGVLTGLAMREPPPADMPQPILMRITGLRPQ